MLQTVLQDVQYGTRVLRRNPAFACIAIFALALGIGVNTAAFTAYKAMVARPLDAREPDGMVNLALIRQSGATDFTFSYSDYEVYRDSLRSFSGVIAESHGPMSLTGAGGVVSQRSSGAGSLIGRLGLLSSGPGNVEFAMTFMVSENYFRVLGVNAVLGRTFDLMSAAELRSSPPVLISDNYWRKRFGADPSLLGKTIRLNNAAFTVAGVTPRDFVGTFVSVPDFWIPLSLAPLVHAEETWSRNNSNKCCRLFARLAPGVDMEQAQAEMTLLANQLRERHEPRSEYSKPVAASVWRGSPFPRKLDDEGGLRLAILLIMIAVAMVLVVACANVAGLQLARATSRRNELAVRLSLGASAYRIIRQLLTESVMLALTAGAIALAITWVLLELGVKLAAEAFPAETGTLIFRVTPDLEIFSYVFGISLIAGVLFGLAPAIESSRGALTAHRGASVRSRRLQNLLITAQVAVSTVLLIAGSLFVRSSILALRTETGYDSHRVVHLDYRFPDWLKYSASRKAALAIELRSRLAVLPGVDTITSARGPASSGIRTASVSLNREQPALQNKHAILHYTYVEPNYFQTLGIPLLFGNGFSALGQREPSAVVSEAAAKRLWPGQNPIGRTVRLSTEGHYRPQDEPRPDGPVYLVIGVVRDTLGVQFDGSDPRQIYLLMPEDARHVYPILIRARSDPAEVTKALDTLLSSVDPNVVAYSSTLHALLRQTGPFIVSSLSAAVASSVGLLGLLLACIGLYGTVSFVVALRTRELGIRIAIGAQRRDILTLIMSESMRPVAIGLFAGMLTSTGVSYVLRGILYGLNVVDGISFAGVALLYTLVAVAAAYPPSRRAMRIDPMVALRYE